MRTPVGTLPPPGSLPEIPLFTASSDHQSGLDLLAAAAATHTDTVTTAWVPPAGQLVTPLPSGYDPVAALPPKLVKRILNLEFVEMADLLPEAWPEESAAADAGHQHRRARRPPVTDILTWLECYASMAAVLSTRYPGKISEFWAYQISILRAARNFEGPAWVAYDRQYRREALARKDLNWSTCNTRLYSEAFTGRARTIPRCQYCLSATHGARSCPANPDPPVSLSQPNNPTSVAPGTAGVGTLLGNRQEICRNFNEGKCRYSRCRYLHICRECFFPHPWVSCHSNQAALQRPRSPRRPRNRNPPFNP